MGPLRIKSMPRPDKELPILHIYYISDVGQRLPDVKYVSYISIIFVASSIGENNRGIVSPLGSPNDSAAIDLAVRLFTGVWEVNLY